MAKKTAARRKTSTAKKPPVRPSNNGSPQVMKVRQKLFRYQEGDDGEVVELRAQTIKMIADRLVAKHRLPRDDDGMIHATPGFEKDLTHELSLVACRQIIPEIALQAWMDAASYYYEEQKKTN